MNTHSTPTLAAVAPATSCCASWVAGDKPDTPKGSSTLMWVTMRHKESGKLTVGVLTYHNGHVMPCSDQCDPPDCAVPHNPEEDGYCEEYEWTCWSDGYCEYCETEWVWHSHYAEIIAHAPVTKPEPFRHNDQAEARRRKPMTMKNELDSKPPAIPPLPPAPGYACFVDSEIGMTMGDTHVRQLPDGTWKATAVIGTLFGSDVEGECSGTGPTKEAALEALAKDRKILNDSLWA